MMHVSAAAVEGIDIALLIVDASTHLSATPDTMLSEKAKRFRGNNPRGE